MRKRKNGKHMVFLVHSNNEVLRGAGIVKILTLNDRSSLIRCWLKTPLPIQLVCSKLVGFGVCLLLGNSMLIMTKFFYLHGNVVLNSLAEIIMDFFNLISSKLRSRALSFSKSYEVRDFWILSIALYLCS